MIRKQAFIEFIRHIKSIDTIKSDLFVTPIVEILTYDDKPKQILFKNYSFN